MLHGVEPAQRAEDGEPVHAGGGQRGVERRGLREQVDGAAAELPGAQRAHLERLRRQRDQHVRDVPRVVGPPAADRLQGGRGALHAARQRRLRPRRRRRQHRRLQGHLLRPEPRRLHGERADAEQLHPAHRRCLVSKKPSYHNLHHHFISSVHQVWWFWWSVIAMSRIHHR